MVKGDSKGIPGGVCEGDDLEFLLKTVYEKADQLGYELEKKVYCLKRIRKINERDQLVYDVSIPFADEEGIDFS